MQQQKEDEDVPQDVINFEMLIEGWVFESKLSKNTERIVFVSSTFDDTKFEQDFLLKNVFPFLEEQLKRLGLSFSIVTMRWGVRAKAMNDHSTSESCMTQLENAKRDNNAVAYMTIQGSRYGFCPLPNIIKQEEFDMIKQYLIADGNFTDTLKYLEEPYWCLDTTAFSVNENGSKEGNVYELQPVSSLPKCEEFLLSEEIVRGRNDSIFKTNREQERKDSSDV